MNTFAKLAQERFAKTRKTKLVQSIENKISFEMKEEALREIAKNVIKRAKQIREGLKNDPVGTVKKYKSLMNMRTLAPAKKRKPTAKKKSSPKKALKKAKAVLKNKKAVH